MTPPPFLQDPNAHVELFRKMMVGLCIVMTIVGIIGAIICATQQKWVNVGMITAITAVHVWGLWRAKQYYSNKP